MWTAAGELGQKLEEWEARDDSNKGAYVARGSRRSGWEPAWIDKMSRVMWLLGECSREIQERSDAGEEMSAWRHFIPKWWHAVVLPDVQWGTHASLGNTEARRDAIASLKAFDLFLQASPVVSRVPDRARLTAYQALDELVTHLEANELGMEPGLRRWILRLVGEIRALLEQANMGIANDEALLRRTTELSGFLNIVSKDLRKSGQKPPPWLNKVVRGMVPFVFVGRASGLALGVVADTLEITDGF